MPNSEVCLVVGSGPAGISCAQGLVARNKTVIILDSGVTLEADRRTAIERLAAAPKSEWSPEDVVPLKSGMTASSSGIPLKLAYGSDYPYREVAGSTSIQYNGSDTKPSDALGGLSTVWGSAVLPYRQEDIPGWPISIDDLAAGYRAVLQWMPLSARQDELSSHFPIYREPASSLPMSRQASGLLKQLQRNREQLNRRGVFFGKSRLAVNAGPSDSQPLCVKCGFCIYGCPHGLIYSTETTLSSLIASGRVSYQPGFTVQRVDQSKSGVIVTAVDRAGKLNQIKGDRVFLGAGLLNTTTILLRSLEQYNSEVLIKDSQYYLLPALRMRGTDSVSSEPLHTLAQLFLEVFDHSISPYTVHLQTYTYNELFREPVLAKLGPFAKLFPLEAFLGRLLLFQGYLHSDHSPPIAAHLERNSKGDLLVLQFFLHP